MKLECRLSISFYACDSFSGKLEGTALSLIGYNLDKEKIPPTTTRAHTHSHTQTYYQNTKRTPLIVLTRKAFICDLRNFFLSSVWRFLLFLGVIKMFGTNFTLSEMRLLCKAVLSSVFSSGYVSLFQLMRHSLIGSVL